PAPSTRSCPPAWFGRSPGTAATSRPSSPRWWRPGWISASRRDPQHDPHGDPRGAVDPGGLPRRPLRPARAPPRAGRDGPVDAAVELRHREPRRGAGAARRDRRAPPRGAAPGPLAAQGAGGVPGAGPPRGRRDRGRRAGAGRGDGPADGGRPGGPAGRPGHDRAGRGPRPPAPQPGRGLRRRQAGQLRGDPGADDRGGPEGPPAPPGLHPRGSRRGAAGRAGPLRPGHHVGDRPFPGPVFRWSGGMMTGRRSRAGSVVALGAPLMTGLRMNVADLLRRPGSTREVHLEAPVAGLENPSTRVDADQPLTIDLRLESLSGGIVASGRVRGHWRAVCSRCLNPLEADFDLALREVFEEDPIEDETYPLRHDEIDLEQPIRDLVVPELPPAPLCDENCLGLCPTCGANRNPVSAGDTPDPPAPCDG